MNDRQEVVVPLSRPGHAAYGPANRPKGARVVLVASHNLVRHGLEKVIAGGDALRVVATAADPSELDLRAAHADVILFGLSQRSDETDMETLAGLAAHGRVLVLLDAPDGPRLIDLLRAGAYGCVLGLAEDDELLQAVTTVARGGFHISPGLADQLRTELCRPSVAVVPVLGRREAEALRWLATGLTHRQVARRMGLTEATVSTYVKRIRGKLDVGNKADLTRIAIEWGLLDEPTVPRLPLPSPVHRPR